MTGKDDNNQSYDKKVVPEDTDTANTIDSTTSKHATGQLDTTSNDNIAERLRTISSLESALAKEKSRYTNIRKSVEIAEEHIQSLHDTPIMRATEWIRKLHLAEMRLAAMLNKGTTYTLTMEAVPYLSAQLPYPGLAQSATRNKDLVTGTLQRHKRGTSANTISSALIQLKDHISKGWVIVQLQLPTTIDPAGCTIEQLSRHGTRSGRTIALHKDTPHSGTAVFKISPYTKYLSVTCKTSSSSSAKKPVDQVTVVLKPLWKYAALLRLAAIVQMDPVKMDPVTSNEYPEVQPTNSWTKSVSRHYAMKDHTTILSNHGILHNIMRNRPSNLIEKMRLQLNDVGDTSYHLWVQLFDTLDDDDRQAIRKHIETFVAKPLVSVIMPVHDPFPAYLEKAIASVLDQIYERWELCIVDDASRSSEVKHLIQRYASKDSRIKVLFRRENGHISAASNDALSMATGAYIAFIDHDDMLPEHALYRIVAEINEHPDAVLIYSDEDKVDDSGNRSDPYFKPDWNLEMMRGQNMVNHLTVMKKSAVDAVGGLRIGYEGAQDWDLVMRVAENLDTDKIRHIPEILYHWRTTQEYGSGRVSHDDYPVIAGRRVIQEHLTRSGVRAKVVPAELPIYNRVLFELPKSPPRVSFIIPTRDNAHLLNKCVRSILDSRYMGSKEIIICDNQSVNSDTRQLFAHYRDMGIKIIKCDFPFNHSKLNNVGVSHATGDVLVLMNNDVWAPQDSWLEELVSQALREEIGAVGVALFYTTKVMQHGGVLLGFGGMYVAGNAQIGVLEGDPGYWGKSVLVQEFSAATAACLAMRKTTWTQIGGFDESFPHHYNDVDLCLRIADKGMKIIWTPYARLYHEESASRGYAENTRKMIEWQASATSMHIKWGSRLFADPFHNPNLSSLHDSQQLAWPPRTKYPWNKWMSCPGDGRSEYIGQLHDR